MRTVGRVLLVALVVAGTLGGSAQAGFLLTGASPTAAASDATPDGPAASVTTPAVLGQLQPARVTTSARDAAKAIGQRQSVAAGADTFSQAQTDLDVRLEQVFRLTPERPGTVLATYNYTLADRIVGLETEIPQRATVMGAEGFVPENETTFAWDEATDNPSITIQLPVNETGSRDYAARNGSLLFADVGQWALFRRPATATSWEATGRAPVQYDRRTVTEGPGAAGEWLVYLGNVTLHPRTVEEQTLRLAVPAAADMRESPDDVLDALERAAAALEVGERDDAVFAIAAPTDGVPWAARGLATGGRDFWVGANERLDTPDNIWVHEYVHTRQSYRPMPTTRWTVEGFATYFAARQALEYQSVSFAEFADALSVPEGGTTNVTLDDPSSWQGLTAYERGALVAGQLDRRLRVETGGDRSLDSVLGVMNAENEPINGSMLLTRIGELSNDSVRSYAASAIAGNRSVTMWNRSQHVAAFGGMPARFHYQLPEADAPAAYRVVGPYRNVSLVPGEPLTVVTGETLIVNAQVRNVGGLAGFYDADLLVNGSVVDNADGEVPPGGQRLLPLRHTFETAGTYVVGVGNETTTVRVRRPANASIVGLSVSRGSIPQYGSATLDVTVRNDAAVPARRTLTITRGAEPVATRSVRVGPRATATASIDVAFPTAGTAEIGVAGAGTLEVEVRPRTEVTSAPTPKPTANETGSTDGPPSLTGSILWPVTFLFVLAAVVVLVRVRR